MAPLELSRRSNKASLRTTAMSSCFITRTTSSASSWSRSEKIRSWRWWRTCAGRLAAAAHSKLRRSSAAPAGLGARRRSPRRNAAAHQYRRSYAPVYVDELYSSQQLPERRHSVALEPPPGTGKPPRAAAAASSGSKLQARRARTVLLSPTRGGATGMGEVDLRAEVFINKFREEMRLQSQRSAEELHAMLARGL